MRCAHEFTIVDQSKYYSIYTTTVPFPASDILTAWDTFVHSLCYQNLIFSRYADVGATENFHSLSCSCSLSLTRRFGPIRTFLLFAGERFVTLHTINNNKRCFDVQNLYKRKKPDRQSTARRVKVRRKTRRKTNCEFMPSTSYRSIQLRQYTK